MRFSTFSLQGSSSVSSGLSSPDKQKPPRHSPLLAPPVKTRTSSSSSGGGGGGGGKSPTTPPSADAAAAQPARKPRRQTSSGKKSRRHRKKTKAMIDPGAIKVCSVFCLFLRYLYDYYRNRTRSTNKEIEKERDRLSVVLRKS